MADRRLIRLFVAALVVWLVVVATTNLLVDPYAYFGTPVVQGLTANKPKAFEHDRFFKAGLARRTGADCLLAGSSRVGEGIPPDHASLARCRKVLDVSMAGPNVGEMTSIVSMATAHHPAATVVLSLDFFAFNALRGDTRGGGTTVFTPDPISRTLSASSILLSTDVAQDSISTLWNQGATSFYLADGSVNQQLLASDSGTRPTRVVFLRSMRGYIFHILAAPSYDFKLSTDQSVPMQRLADFIREQHRRGTRLVMFFSPAHAWQWELVDTLGLWSDWEQWKREVVRVNESSENLHGQRPFALWDFAGYRGVALEEVPKDYKAAGGLPHYWDASHFKRRLGTKMLDQMLASEAIDDAFGWILNSANVDASIARNRSDRALWRERSSQDLQDIRSTVACFAPNAVRSRLRLPPMAEETCQKLRTLTR